MLTKVVLWTYYPRKDGRCNIKIYVSFNGVKKYIKTKFHVLPEEFDEKFGRVKKNNPNHFKINTSVGEKKREIELQLIEQGDLRRVGGTKVGSFINFLSDYTIDIKKGFTNHKLSTAKSYSALLKRLTQYKTEKNLLDISFNDIDLDFYEDFRKFLFERIGCGIPGFSKHIKVIKTVMRVAQDKGLHKNELYKHHLFKRFRDKPANKIYLTQEEIQALQDVDLSNDPGLDRERDRFLISYYFLMRYEDSTSVNFPENVTNQNDNFKVQNLIGYEKNSSHRSANFQDFK